MSESLISTLGVGSMRKGPKEGLTPLAHIDDSMKLRNIYETKPVKTVYSMRNRNPSQGYTHLFWETDSAGKNYYVIYGNLGDHIDKSERYIEKRVYDWKE